MLRRVTKFGEKVLKQKTAKIAKFDDELKKLAEDLFDTLYDEKGLGLAAPQIGVSQKVFIIDMRQRLNTDTPCVFKIDGKELPIDIAMPLVAVNPTVEEIGDYVEIADEGCLSFPGIFAEVERSCMVKMNYFDVNGVPHELVCEGLFARCVQHENDHLQGICFVDYLTQRQLFKIEPKLKKLKRQTRDFLKGSEKTEK